MYNFDTLTDRFGTFSYKWDVEEHELPMWVADMDFECAPAIKEAVIKRAEHGVYGYSTTPDEFFEVVSGYFERRHGFKIPTEWMVYSNGVVAAISSAVRKLTTPAENVLIQAPVYNIFYNSILNNGRNVLSSDLVLNGEGYEIDFEDLEKKLAMPQTTLMILCNPHNPVGRVASKDELKRIGALCKKHGVTVISDEIHCDFVRPGMKYTPFAAVDDVCRDISVSCVSASKSFNIAGLQSACIYSANPFLRQKMFRAVNTDEVGEPNAFSMVANIAAYNECDEWIKELNEYVFKNREYAEKFIKDNLPDIKVVGGDATYLMWIDVGALKIDSSEFVKLLREKTGLYILSGSGYGEGNKSFVRINIATQRSRLEDGMNRLYEGIKMITK